MGFQYGHPNPLQQMYNRNMISNDILQNPNFNLQSGYNIPCSEVDIGEPIYNHA